MKLMLVASALLAFVLSGCATPPPPLVPAARLFTLDNREVVVYDLKVWEKNYQVESRRFHPRWRQSLERISLNFNEIAAAEKVAPDRTRVYFRDGSQDEFEDFFMDEYNLKGWSEYGPFEINSALIRGLIFLDQHLQPVPGAVKNIPPTIIPPDYQDRFVTLDSDVISGDILEGEFAIRTDYGRLILKRQQLTKILVDREGDSLRQIAHFINGDIISGWIEPGRVRMRIPGGQVVTMEFDQLNRVLFRRPVAVGVE